MKSAFSESFALPVIADTWHSQSVAAAMVMQKAYVRRNAQRGACDGICAFVDAQFLSRSFNHSAALQ